MFPERYLGAAVATTTAILVYGVLIATAVAPGKRRLAVCVALFSIPVTFATSFWIYPMAEALRAAALPPGALSNAIRVYLFAPVLEEPMKWLAFLVALRVVATVRENALLVALAIGLGFGVGEFWTQAYHSRGETDLLFSMFVYPSQRLACCFVHGALLALVAIPAARGHRIWPAALLAIAMHGLVNLPWMMLVTMPNLAPWVAASLNFFCTVHLLAMCAVLYVLVDSSSGGRLSEATTGRVLLGATNGTAAHREAAAGAA